MPKEFASNSTRSGVIVPTREDFEFAKSRGLETITSAQLVQLRAEARAAKRAPAKAAPAVAKTKPAPKVAVSPDATRIAKLKRQVERLSNEIATLKGKLMAAC